MTARQPFYLRPEDVPVPEGWTVKCIVDCYEQLPVGDRHDQNSVSDSGRIPVIDQSESGFIGYHDEAPGVIASADAPVFTFANHTCAMRLVDHPFSVIQNVFPKRGIEGETDTVFLRYATCGRQLTEEYKGHHPTWRNSFIPLPPVRTQVTIGRCLRRFDDLIENNRRRIEILEEMARLIYRDWFVHFRFPGHEDVEFVDSGLGRVPSDWRVAVTSELIAEGVLEIGDGYRAKNSEFAGECFVFLRVKNVREGYLNLTGADYLPEQYGTRVGGKVAVPGDCVICMKGTVGRMAFVSERTPPIIYSPQVSYWRSLDAGLVSSLYLRLWMQSPAFIDQCARVKGATDMADYVNLRDQRSMLLALPTAPVHEAFVDRVAPLLKLADNLRGQIEVLSEARDLLLPRLISGELDVSDLELDLESVA